MTAARLIATWPFAEAGVRAAWPALAAGGDPLDACLAVCREAELDPRVDSVGWGGSPDASGRMSLDGMVMRSPSRVGSVCALRHHLHPCEVARRVMERTAHVMLVGPDADAFADEQGLESAELLEPGARERWEAWRRGDGPDAAGHDTITALALSATGELAGACSTSGRAWKLPGRVGDSPLPGHGLYVDPDVGAAGATGSGERIQGLCSSFHVVEELRRGASPTDALARALERVQTSFELAPDDQVALIALRADGAWASAALRPGFAAIARGHDGEARLEPRGLLE